MNELLNNYFLNKFKVMFLIKFITITFVGIALIMQVGYLLIDCKLICR